MFKKIICLQLAVLFFCCVPVKSVQADEYLSYEELILLGKQSLRNQNYPKALFYFHLSRLSNPSAQEALNYINLVKRLQQGRVDHVDAGIASTSMPVTSEKRQEYDLVSKSIEYKKATITQEKKKTPPSVSQANHIAQVESPTVIVLSTKSKKKYQQQVKSTAKGPSSSSRSVGKSVVLPKTTDKNISSRNQKSKSRIVVPLLEELMLSDDLWSRQPKTKLNVEINQSFIIRGNHIERFLVLTPGFIDVERVDRDRIRIVGKSRGGTFLHIWDQRGRWTFDIEVIFFIPESESKVTAEVDTDVENAAPFRFDYSNDWNSYYLGNSLPNLQRQNLNFSQRTAIYGPTPYGDFDSSAGFTKFDQSTEVTNYTVGLTDGKIGNFKDFSIRGFDVSRRFSDLSLPGKYLRGIFFTSKVFNQNIQYEYLRGKDRSIFGFLSPGVATIRESYIEGARVTLFPDKNHQTSLNYARGFGEAREDFLKKQVVSLDTKHRWNKNVLEGEIGYDEEALAKIVKTQFGSAKRSLRLNFRDIEKDYVTASSIPTDQGEVGGNIIGEWDINKARFYSNLDVYRDRAIFNPDYYNAANLDWNGSIEAVLSPESNWRTSMYYTDTPQLLSPRQNAQVQNTYSHRWLWWPKRPLSTYVGHSLQRSRFKFSPSSEYDRAGVMGGFSLPIFKSLSYFANFEYSWVKEIDDQEKFQPNVINTGFGYNKKISDHWSGNLGLTYRNEEQTEGLHSFLAGEDSITGSIGASYHPTSDFEFFVDGRVRNIWRENTERVAYNEGEVRFGVRSSWEMPLRWSPQGEVRGLVFKDANGNGKHDPGEQGIPGIKIKVGKQEIQTNGQGDFALKVRANRVAVGILNESIPDGFVSSTSLLEKVPIQQGKISQINFGLTTHSGIYGVVFFDKNGNGQPDPEDKMIPRVKFILDGKTTVYSDFEGGYFFNNLEPGKHSLRIDVNSLPLEYLPGIKLKHELFVKEGTTYVLHVPLKGRATP